MISFLSLAALFACLAVGLLLGAAGIAKRGHCADGEDHYVCFREWLKAATPLVALSAAFVAAVGGLIALQNLREIQKSRLEQAANVERTQIAAIVSEKEAFLEIYRSEFVEKVIGKLKRPTIDISATDLKNILDGLTNFRRENQNWLLKQYAVGPASIEIGNGRHAFDKVTADLAYAITDAIAAYIDHQKDTAIGPTDPRISHAIVFYNNDFKDVCDIYWDSLDKELSRLQADIADLDRRAIDR